MSVLSMTERNSLQKNEVNTILSMQTAVSESGLLSNTFHFWNGDEYTGQFAIVKEKQNIVMQGRGVYKTSDGQIYEGIWDNDYLRDECKVTFPDKVVFSGNLDEMVIRGLGKYKFKENVEIEGDFVNNSLIGEVLLKDPNHHMWKGKVDKDGFSVDFYPLHPFWQSVLNLPSKTDHLFYGEAADENEIIWEGLY